MLMVAGGAIPRGGTLTVDAADGGYRVIASGLNARLTAATAELLGGAPASRSTPMPSSRSIPGFWPGIAD